MSSGFRQGDQWNRSLAIVEMTSALGPGLVSRSSSDLGSSSRALLARCTSGLGLDEDALIAEACAIYIESSRRAGGISYSRDQLLAAAAMCLGAAPELPKGTSGSAGMATYWYSLRCQGVHVLVADDYLAQREALSLAMVMEPLDRRVALLSEGMSDAERRQCYLADITVAPYAAFLDDYLREHLPISDFDPIQRNRYVAVIGDGSSIALGRAAERRGIVAPVADVPHLTSYRSQLDLDRTSARLLSGGGAYIQDGAVRLNRMGIVMLAEELGIPEFSSEFAIAAKDVCSQLQSSQTGDVHDEVLYLEIALFAYLNKYSILACTLWSADEDASDLQRLYGLTSVQFSEKNGITPSGLVVYCADPAQRLGALRDRVGVSRSAGAPVVVRAMGHAQAEACVTALGSQGIESMIARAGHELEAFAQSRAHAAVTIVEPDTTLPESLDADVVTELASVRLTWRAGLNLATANPHDIYDMHRANRRVAGHAMAAEHGRLQYVSVGTDTSPSFIAWCRMASTEGAEAWMFVCDDDPLVRELDSETLASLHRLSEPVDKSDPDGSRRTVGAQLYSHAQAIVHRDRLAEWAFRLSVEKPAELFYELRSFIAAAPVNEVVERLINDYAAEAASLETTNPEAIQRAVSAVVGERRAVHQEEPSSLWVKRHLTEVYDEVRRQSDLSTLEPFVRDIMLRGIGDTWCRFLTVASFLRLHLAEAYPPDNNWHVKYWRDLSSRFAEMMQDFRRTTLQLILTTGSSL